AGPRGGPAHSGAFEEQVPLARITRKRCRALELHAGLVEPAELCEEVAAHAWQEVVGLERRLRSEPIDKLKTGFRAKGHGERDGTIQLYYGRGHELGERIVERGDAPPLRFCRRTRASVTCGDRRLKRIGAERTTESMAEFLGTLERGQTATDEDMVPARAILIENQDRLSCGTDSSTGSRSLNLHERDEAMNFRLVRNKSRENSAEAERVFAERRAHPVFTGGGGVAFED